jgi:UDP-N-acetylmuramyl pentapeptide phosphotransferase/UDP-N-acetylglucosamine-1-phosphate transferase
MINEFIKVFNYYQSYILILITMFLIMTLFWKNITSFFNLKSYSNSHRIHFGEISRLGGHCIYGFLILFSIHGSIEYSFVNNILISSFPFFLICLKEDLFHNTSPQIRLVCMILSCLIFFYINPIQFPNIDLPILNNILNNEFINLVFFIFSLLVLMNGMNLIDGLNGLFSFTAIFQLFSLIVIANIYNEHEVIVLSVIFLIPLIIFLIFNFPFGFIFSGDFGAYFYGFVIGLLTLYLFGKNSFILSWLAVLILIYPCMELLFSFIRKKFLNSSNPFDPDKNHLHTKIAIYLSNKIRSKYANPLGTILLIIFWLSPTIFTYYFFNDVLLIFSFILFFVILYIFIFMLIVKKENKY